jgi:hypothetical protein|tara:strand:+ start:1013 stop:1240 length:228 start_codon:yes stop_codon:yes gene_type:complete
MGYYGRLWVEGIMIMKTIARLPIEEFDNRRSVMKKFVVGEMIFKKDENGHVHSFPTYFDQKVEKEKYHQAGRVGP